MSKGAILVFARRPELGRVKTRLAAILGDRSALALYRAFLTDTLLAADETGATVLFAYTPGPHFSEQEFADITFEQQGASFGERFDAALNDAANRLPKGTPLILIGADTPHLSPEFLQHTLSVLRDSEAVIGPNFNGGFYLIGFSKGPVPISEAFAHPSAIETVEVARLLRQAGLKPELLEFSFDVDTPLDLLNLTIVLDVLEAVGSRWVPKHTQSILHNDGIVSSSIRELAAKWLKTPKSPMERTAPIGSSQLEHEFE